MLQGIKVRIGKRVLKRERNAKRNRKGCNYKLAQKVALIYMDKDETHFKKIKDYVAHLHNEQGIRKVLALGYIDSDEKKVPVWQTHKLEFEYFTNDDLNWYSKPGQNTMLDTFVGEEYDILIDLTKEECVPVGFLVSQSKATMKVGQHGGFNESDYDLIINLEKDDFDKYLEQLDFYLSNFNIQ